MSLCPAFHCSRCGFAHADECVPAPKSLKELWEAQVKTANETWKVPVFTAPLGRVQKGGFTPPSAPAVPPQPATRTQFIIPNVGSIWKPEIRYSENDPWQNGNTLYEYMVVANHPNYQVEVDTIPAGGHSLMTFDSDHFLPAGKFEGSCYLRFIFVR